MNNISIEQRNAQKLHNLLNIANLNIKNRDIYFFLKCNVKVLFNKLQLPKNEREIFSGHVSAFTIELNTSKWDLRQFDPKKYQKFLNDLFDKIDFRKVDTDFMFKCRDLLEVSPIKDDLYNKRMEFFDKKLPKIGGGNPVVQNNQNINSNNTKNSYGNFVNNVTKVNMKVNNNNNNNFNQPIPINPFADINEININNNNVQNNPNNSLPVNPFSDMTASSNPFTNQSPSPYQQNIEINNVNNINNINNTNEKGLLRSIPKTGLNQINNNYNNIEPQKQKLIPEFIKQSIIKELEAISTDLVNSKVDDARQHSVEVLLYFKQIFPDN